MTDPTKLSDRECRFPLSYFIAVNEEHTIRLMRGVDMLYYARCKERRHLHPILRLYVLKQDLERLRGAEGV